MALISKLPQFIQTPLMKAGMAAMTNPQAALKRAALITLPLNIGVLMLPHLIKLAVLVSTKSYNNVSPRGEEQTDVMKKHQYAALVERCQAAHRNSTQCFPYVSGSCVILAPQLSTYADRPILQMVRERCLSVLRHRHGKSPEIAATGGLSPN